MKLAKTIQLDDSDKKVYLTSAEQGEWAVTGTFLFTDIDPTSWNKKQQISFRDGWLGTDTFGFSTFVQVSDFSEKQKDEVTHKLSAFIYETFNPPGMLSAFNAAEKEIHDMSSLCDHPIGTILSIKRELNDEEINEKIRIVNQKVEDIPVPIWTVDDK